MANSGGPERSVLSAILPQDSCGIMSIDKDKYLTQSQSTRSTRSSRNSQYCRPQTDSDALKYSFFPRTIPHCNSLAPSMVAAETTEEFRALI